MCIRDRNDACGIDTVRYDPAFVNCTSNGQNVPITITVVDENGNSSTCQSILVVNTLPLMPLWESQLCDDTLRLFANLPGEPDTIYTFSWTGPGGFTSMEENPVIPDSDTSDTGLYILTVESDNGCVTMGSVDIVVEELTAQPSQFLQIQFVLALKSCYQRRVFQGTSITNGITS